MKKVAATLLAVALSALAGCHTTRHTHSAESFTSSSRSDSTATSATIAESRARTLIDDSTDITIVDIEYLYTTADSVPQPAKARVRQITKHSHLDTSSNLASAVSETSARHSTDSATANASASSSHQSSHTPSRTPAATILIILTFILICYDYYTHHRN
ncbi:MAG: hypothetical protein ACI4A8_04955 [Muribaculaceae bacterium]